MKNRPRICIDARLEPGLSGGIEQVVTGLAHGLSSLPDGNEEYYFLTHTRTADWLAPHLAGNCRLLYGGRSFQKTARRTIASRFPSLRKLLENAASLAPERAVSIPHSNGVIEKSGMDLMHFTFQAGFLTDLPTIYHPHDLQHIHLPEYFSEYERRGRTLVYKRFCDQAHTVAVSSSWVRQDLEEQLGIARDKIAIVPLAPSTGYGPVADPIDPDSIRRKFDLPDKFAFYPAQTWPHKNHLGLIEAVRIILEQYNIRIPLVFSGRKTDFYLHLKNRVTALGLEGQVKFLGFVTHEDLQSLYRSCRCVIIPTKFEAASFPLWEAFLAMAPAACSNVTSLPRQAGNAALTFDPNDSGQIASCLYKLWTDAGVRRDLAKRGWDNVTRFSWQNTALAFRAHYRRILGLTLTQQDVAILKTDPII